MAEETVILHLKVDQAAGERQLERIEGVLLDNKKAVQDLQAAYKKGNITQAEYVKENIRLQQNIKKEQELKKTLIKTIETESNSRNALKARISTLVKEYDNLNLAEATGIKRADALEKELAQLNAQLTKGDKSAGLFKNQIGNYPKVLGDAASQIRVAGVSVGELGTKLASLANPVTASVAVIGALGAAYARSTLGAKDLAFAQSQIAAATTLITNQFAALITSAKDGEGAVTTIINGFLKFVDKIPIIALYSRLIGIDLADIAEKSKEIALAQEKLEDLSRLELQVRANASERLEANQELMEDIANEQLTINQRLESSQKIEDALILNKGSILSVLNMELAVIEEIAKANAEDEDLQNKVLEKKQQINQESVALERQITKINKLQDDLNRKLGDEARLRREAAAFNEREANAPLGTTAAQLPVTSSMDAQFQQEFKDASEFRQDIMLQETEVAIQTEAEKRKQAQLTADFNKSVDQARVQSAKIVFTALAGLAEEGSAEQRALTLVSIALDTAQAIAGATAASQDVPYPGNLVAMATSIATVLSNIGAAYQAIKGFEEGGYTGDGGKHDVAGVVHKGEYVVPQSVNYAPAAQPHIHALESMRVRGYADGGFVANQSTAPVNQSLIIANALNRLPRPIVDVREVTSAQRRVEVRESQATLS